MTGQGGISLYALEYLTVSSCANIPDFPVPDWVPSELPLVTLAASLFATVLCI